MSFLFQTKTDADLSMSGNNVFLDDMPLLEKNTYGQMQPREKPVLNKLLSHFYHGEVEMTARLEGNLASIAKAMNEERRAVAAILLVHMNLPRRDMVVKYNQNHAPAHAPNSTGGQFTSDHNDGVTDDDLKNPQFKGMDRTQIKKQKFILANLASLVVGAKQLNVPMENLVALSATESSWGTSPQAINDKNFFGLHSPASGESGSRPAEEDPHVHVASFKSFDDSMDSFIQDYGYLVRNISDPTLFAQKLQNSKKFGINPGGSKRPDYVPTIVSIAKDIPTVISHIRDYP